MFVTNKNQINATGHARLGDGEMGAYDMTPSPISLNNNKTTN